VNDVNRAWWDEAAVDHFERTYDLSLVRGGSSLFPIEAAELPTDLTGQRVAHLQCHIGPDTLSLARRGADVVGLDFSPEAIARARRLADELGIDATFVEAPVQEARTVLEGDFDGRLFVSDEQGDYMDATAVRTNTVTHEYTHGLGEIVTAIVRAGIPVDWLHEHDAAPWNLGDDLVEGVDRLWRRPGSDRPLSFSLRGTR
jgi:hypothetical protein